MKEKDAGRTVLMHEIKSTRMGQHPHFNPRYLIAAALIGLIAGCIYLLHTIH